MWGLGGYGNTHVVYPGISVCSSLCSIQFRNFTSFQFKNVLWWCQLTFLPCRHTDYAFTYYVIFPKIHMTCCAYMSILNETIFEIKYFEHIYYQYLSVIIYLYLQQSDNKMNSRILVYWHDQNEQYVRYLHLVFCHSLFVPIYNDSLKIKGLHFRL